MLGFQNWASEVGIVTQHPQGQPAKPPAPSASTPAQTASVRPRATDNMSRQASAASNLSSPPLNTSSPQYSPPNQTTKFSPPINVESLPLGKRYIGPVITEEPDPMDEELLKSKMADDYQQYKIGLRIQMIYDFHAAAAAIEIKLFESLLADQGTKESRARAVQEHETSMMRLREQKEEERKRRCAEERERRREEMRQRLAQRRPAQNREVEPSPKPSPSVPWLDKPSTQQRPGKATHQKENVPLPPPAAGPSAKLEAPSIIKKSSSTLSQDEASANEALFADALAMMNQGKSGSVGLTPAQASLNETLFSNAAAVLATQGQVESNGKNTLQPPSIMKKSNSSRSQEYDIPHITVSLAETSTVAPEPAQPPPPTLKGKKGKKGQPAVQPPPAKPVTITEELEMDAEWSPSAPSLWDAAAVAAKNAFGVASAAISMPKSKLGPSVEEDRDVDDTFTPAPVPSKGPADTKKAPPALKKGKKVSIIEEPDIDANPIVSPPPASKTKVTKGGWGSVSGKSKVTPPLAEESEPVLAPQPPPVASGWGKKPAQAPIKSALKPQLKVAISEEQESEVEQGPAFGWTGKTKSAWDAPAFMPSANSSTQVGKKAGKQQAESRRAAMTPGSQPVRAAPITERNGPMTDDDVMIPAGSEEVKALTDTSAWFNPENMSYWANMAGQPEVETQAVPEPTEPTGKHVRWTPTVGGVSDDEEGFDEADEDLATNMWMQYAISGGDLPSLDSTPGVLPVMPPESVQRDTGLWGQGTTKPNPPTGDVGNRAQQTSVLDRATFSGQWPKMDSWLSPPARGQSSSSSRVF